MRCFTRLKYVLPALLIATGTTFGDPTFQDNGDPMGSNYYRTIVQSNKLVTVGDNTFFTPTDGILYSSNTSPLGDYQLHGTQSINGATVTTDARSTLGGFQLARNYVNLQVGNAQSNDGYYSFAGQGTKSVEEFFTSTDATLASATYHWHMSGVDAQPVGQATGRLDFFASLDNQSWFNVFNTGTGIHAFGPGDYSTNIPAATGVPIYLYYWSSAFAQINQGQAADGASYQLQADYLNTFSLDSIDLYDQNGAVIPEWTLQDMNGDVVFNQNGRVPEPSALALIALSFPALFRRQR